MIQDVLTFRLQSQRSSICHYQLILCNTLCTFNVIVCLLPEGIFCVCVMVYRYKSHTHALSENCGRDLVTNQGSRANWRCFLKKMPQEMWWTGWVMRWRLINGVLQRRHQNWLRTMDKNTWHSLSIINWPNLSEWNPCSHFQRSHWRFALIAKIQFAKRASPLVKEKKIHQLTSIACFLHGIFDSMPVAYSSFQDQSPAGRHSGKEIRVSLQEFLESLMSERMVWPAWYLLKRDGFSLMWLAT